jgi:hypothetical protein
MLRLPTKTAREGAGKLETVDWNLLIARFSHSCEHCQK